MRPELVRSESLVEFFGSLIDEALTHQRLKALELTRYYLVQLLARRSRLPGDGPDAREEEPLALRLGRAIDAGGRRQRTELRDLADHTLFVSGFFSDSLARSVVDVDYYASLGGYCYQKLSAYEGETLAPAFAELGRRFLSFADVLTEVSEQSGVTSDRDLLRLYERWIQYSSPRNTERLLRRGIVPSGQAVQASVRPQ
jgi:hypothetical protein